MCETYPTQKSDLLAALRESGWEVMSTETANLDWWADEQWVVESTWSPRGFRLVLSFLVDPNWEGNRRKGQGVWAIGVSGAPNNQGGGTPETVIPMIPNVNADDPDPDLGYSNVFDPNYVPYPGAYTNDTRCVSFFVEPGETEQFEIDNQYPGGEPRTIGYWKNWNTCTGGNQANTAAANGGPDAGWYILDDLLNDPGFTIGVLELGGLAQAN